MADQEECSQEAAPRLSTAKKGQELTALSGGEFELVDPQKGLCLLLAGSPLFLTRFSVAYPPDKFH